MDMVRHNLHFFNGDTDLIRLLLKKLLQPRFNISD